MPLYCSENQCVANAVYCDIPDTNYSFRIFFAETKKRKACNFLLQSLALVYVVGMTRLELATTRPPDAYANQLRHIPNMDVFRRCHAESRQFFGNQMQRYKVFLIHASKKSLFLLI